MDFGSKLRDLRIRAGLTQQQLGQRIGVTKSVISFYELRERSPSPDVLIKLTGVFHVSADYLLGIDETSSLDISGIDDADVALLRALADRLRNKDAE